MDKRPGSRYAKACKALSGKEVDEGRMRLAEEEKRHLRAREKLKAMEAAAGGDEGRMARARRGLDHEQERHEKAKRKVLQPDFNDAVYYLGLDITPAQAVRFASLGAASSLLFMLFMYVALLRTVPSMGDMLRSYVLPVVFALPLILFAFLSSYPEMLAKRVQASLVGKTPEPINYMTMSLRTSPTLERAVLFASEHCDEPMASHLKRVIWEVSMRKHSSVEASLTSFAYKWGRWDEDFKRSLYVIRGSTLERTREGFERSLEKAHTIALNGAKEKVEEFASRLSGPATVLFALGVVLPLMVGSMVPMQSMELPAVGSAMSSSSSSNNMVVPLVLAMDVAFPFITFLYAYMILGRRPGTMAPPEVEASAGRGAFFLALSMGILPLMVYVPFFSQAFPFLSDLGLLPVLLSLSLFTGTWLFLYSRSAYLERKRLLAMERDLPDALFQLGNRMVEGEPLETAFDSVAITMASSPMAPLFKDISCRLSISHSTLEDVLFSRDGVLTRSKSRALKASMRSLLEAVKKDQVSAGQTVLQTAGYIKDLQKVDHDIRVKLQSVVDMMRTTSMFFAPMVMGITVAMYSLLSQQFSQLGDGGGSMLLPMDFALIMGVYLMLSTVISSYFVIGISEVGDKVSLARSIGIGLPLSTVLFVLSVIGGRVYMV